MDREPIGWYRNTLAEIVDAPIVYGIVQAGPHCPGGVPYIKSSDVGSTIQTSKLSLTSPEIAKKYSRSTVRPGDIVFSLRGNIGELSIVPDELPSANLTQGTARIRPAANVDRDFLAYALCAPVVQARVSIVGKGSTFREISLEELRKLEIAIPSHFEQQRIAAILRAWDEAIDRASSLLSTKRKHFAGVRRKYIEACCKLAKGPVPLERISTRIRRKNNGQEHPVMTISAKFGFMLQSDKYSREMAGSSLEHYTLLRKGEFAYNKGNSLTSPQGCIFRLDRDSALVPHVYFSFSLADKASSDFFVHVFESGYLNHQLFRVINSGVRNDGLLNLAVEDFFRCTVPYPPYDEQVRIARTLDALKSEIRLFERQLELLQKQKRGLMQKLLTGEWRVKADGGAL